MHTVKPQIEQWGVYELTLSGPGEGNPFVDVSIQAQFRHEQRTVEVNGFYDGAGIYKVRFMPDEQGEWICLIRSNRPELDGQTAAFECIAPSEGNHGPVRVDKTYHFRYADGTCYSCIGTTSYAWIHQGETLARQTLDSLKTSPFNKLRMTVFPKSYIYNEYDDPERFPFPLLKKGCSTWDGHWESKGGKIEWEFDFTRFDTVFFAMLDERIRQLMEIGVEADVILFHPYDRWGFAQMNRETDLFYLRYIIARLSAFRNVWWSLANEFDFLRDKRTEDWDAIGSAIAACNPYHRPISIHNGFTWFDHHRPWIMHCSIQTGEFKIAQWRDEYRKPIVIDEMCYEGNVPFSWGNLSALEMVHRFWDVALNGGYPGHSEVYLTPEHVMWWNKGGALKGESPARIAFLRELLESGPEVGVEPHPERMNYLTCGFKTERWILSYTGVRQPIEALAKLLPGQQYNLTYLDIWNMTFTPTGLTITGAADEVRIPLTGKPYAAFLLEATD